MEIQTALKARLRNFLDAQGRLTGFPAKRKMRMYALLYLAMRFEADRVYTERDVNELLQLWHTFGDPATLRREMFDAHFLDRSPDGREYRLSPDRPTPEALGLESGGGEKKALLYIHGKGGSAAEAERFAQNGLGFEAIGVDDLESLPWLVEKPLRAAYEEARQKYSHVFVLANSIGAYFAMHALQHCQVERALFISPVLDMERLILDMMGWAQVSEEVLRERGEIPTAFGEMLSWKYLCYVREHPIQWNVPTDILYAGGDQLISRDTVDAFVKTHRAKLTVLEGGEHWFHTDEQLRFLDDWLKATLADEQERGRN